MTDRISRRSVVRGGLLAGLIVPASAFIGPLAAGAADLAPLDPKDPRAVTLGFVDDPSKVDMAANPSYNPRQTCANCQQYQGKPGDARGGCVLFAGASVPAGGWCKVWRKTF